MHTLTSASIAVHIKGEGVDDVSEPLGELGVRQALPEREVKHLEVGVQ